MPVHTEQITEEPHSYEDHISGPWTGSIPKWTQSKMIERFFREGHVMV